MHKRKTRVFKAACFWRVSLYHCDTWIVLRDLHSTRADARKAAALIAIN